MIRFALIAASTLGFVLTAAFGNLIVPLFAAVKPPRGAQQEPPPAEAQHPPVLGGLCLMTGTTAAVGVGWTAACAAQPELLGSGLMSRLLIALAGALLFGAVGAADDLVRRRKPLGLRRGRRLLSEAAAAAAVLLLLAANDCLSTGLVLPGAGYVELGAAAPLLWGLLLVAQSESARAADGADGTVCGAAFVAMLGLMWVLTLLGWFPLAVLPAGLAGALMAFLLWNFPPAKLCPGKAGCQFLAGALGCVPLSIGWPELALPLSLPFWLEGGMVALQIVFSRCFGRPLFAAAPLHRWLEKRGKSPVGIFYLFCAAAVCGLWLTMQLARMSG